MKRCRPTFEAEVNFLVDSETITSVPLGDYLVFRTVEKSDVLPCCEEDTAETGAQVLLNSKQEAIWLKSHIVSVVYQCQTFFQSGDGGSDSKWFGDSFQLPELLALGLFAHRMQLPLLERHVQARVGQPMQLFGFLEETLPELLQKADQNRIILQPQTLREIGFIHITLKKDRVKFDSTDQYWTRLGEFKWFAFAEKAGGPVQVKSAGDFWNFFHDRIDSLTTFFAQTKGSSRDREVNHEWCVAMHLRAFPFIPKRVWSNHILQRDVLVMARILNEQFEEDDDEFSHPDSDSDSDDSESSDAF